MELETCQHISSAMADEFAEITSDSGDKHSLCFDCYLTRLDNIGKRGAGSDPVEVIGYHVYRSVDPDLPKSQWTRVTSKPIPDNKFKDRGLAGGITYYYYVTAVSSQGIESPPSVVSSAVPANSDLAH